MALIDCPECGEKISDKALVCPKCGFRVKEDNKRKGDIDFTVKKPNINWKRLVAVIGIAIIIVAAFFAYKGISNSKLTDTDNYVISCIKNLKGIKNNICLENDILYSKNKDNNVYVIAEIKSSDGYEVVYFENGIYIGSDSDYATLKQYDINDVISGRISQAEYETILNKLVSFASAEVELTSWNLMMNFSGNGAENQCLVNSKKIAKAIGVSCNK